MYGILVHHDINSLYINVGVLIGVYMYQFSHTSKWSTECGEIVFWTANKYVWNNPNAFYDYD